MINIARPSFSENKFREVYGYETEVEESIYRRVNTRIRQINKDDIKSRLNITFCSFALTMEGYTPKKFLSDVIAGLVVGFVRLPQG